MNKPNSILYFQLIFVVSCISIGVAFSENITAATTEASTTVTEIEQEVSKINQNNRPFKSNNDVSLLQVGTLRKFQNFGRAYTIPTNQTFEEFYEEYLEKTPEIINVTSENYPEPYPVDSIKTFKINVENCTGIELIIHILDIDPIKDYLEFSIFSPDSNEKLKSFVFTGELKEAILLRALGTTELTIEFGAFTEPDHKHKGFLFTYKPYGEISQPSTIPPDVTIPFDDLEYLTKYIIVDRKWENTTWSDIKTVLCNATNKYINSTIDAAANLEKCHPENITFTKILQCQSDWPDSKSCIELNFAVTLFQLKPKHSDPFLEESNPKIPGGLYYSNLNQMWNEYGKMFMDTAGYPEYQIPDKETQLFLWGGLALGLILICFIVVIAIYRAGYCGSRWAAVNENDSNDNKVQQDIDITMFPSPDQVVPVLFPSNTLVGYGGGFDNNNGTDYPRFSENYIRDSDLISNRPRTATTNEYCGDINKAFIGDDEQSEIIYEKKLNSSSSIISQEKANQ